MAVEDQLSDEIANFLLEREVERERRGAQEEERGRRGVASEEDVVAGSRVGKPWQETVIFFASGAKICAKFAHDSLSNTKFSVNLKRQRAALAACFFGDFGFFSSLLCCDKTSTTPQ